jgi:hypothetical protein
MFGRRPLAACELLCITVYSPPPIVLSETPVGMPNKLKPAKQLTSDLGEVDRCEYRVDGVPSAQMMLCKQRRNSR